MSIECAFYEPPKGNLYVGVYVRSLVLKGPEGNFYSYWYPHWERRGAVSGLDSIYVKLRRRVVYDREDS